MFTVNVAIVLLCLHSAVAVTNVHCPGATVANSAPGSEDCSAPTCTAQIVAQNKLFPHLNPLKFYQCGIGLNHYEMSCGVGTCFSYEQQVCVHAKDWKNPCKVEEVITTTVNPEESTTETTESVTNTDTTEEPNTTTEGPEIITTEATEVSTTDGVTEEPEPIETTIIPQNPTTTTTEAPPKAPFTGQICPGVDRATVQAGDYDCNKFVCKTETLRQKFPTPDPQYYQYYTMCFGELGILKEVKCATGCFSMEANACVEASKWVNSCRE